MGIDGRGDDARRLSAGAVRLLAVMAVPLALVAGVLEGLAGVAGVATGIVLVATLFVGGAELLRLVTGWRPERAVLVMIMGCLARLLAYATVLGGLGHVGGIHRTTVAMTTGIAVASVLGHELRLLASMPRLFWIDADIDRPQGASNATRSQPL